MANLKHCKKCNRLFSPYLDEDYCSRCKVGTEEEFKIVRNFVYDHPEATIKDAAEGTDVAEELILQFIREGRLILKGDHTLLSCERCGVKIDTGRFCPDCTRELRNELSSAGKKKEEPKKAEVKKRDQMHIRKN